jgi:hypothetical protein
VPVDYSKMVIAIATHNRPVYAQTLADSWAATAPAYREMRVIVNHPLGAEGFTPPPRCSILRTGRPPEHPGCMARTWNLAMLWAFRDPEVEWLLCSMDDTEVLPGWPAILEKRKADLYLAPASDLCFLMSREVFRRVGWNDERFPVMAYDAWDWQARVVREMGPERVVSEDAHGWHISPIGLSAFWKHIGNGAAPTSRPRDFEIVNRTFLEEKWGAPPVQSGTAFWFHAMTGSGPLIPEIDWYPWCDRGAAR